MLLVGAVIWLAASNLTSIARWGLRRALPAVSVELGAIRYHPPGRIAFNRFALRDPETGETLLRLAGGSIVFSLDDLRHGRVGEVRLVNPELVVTPNLLRLFPSSAGGKGSAGPDWRIGRLVCDYGEGSCDGFGPDKPSVKWKFAFDWKGVGLQSDAPIDLVLWDIQAVVPGFSEPFLELDLVNLKGSPREIVRDLALSAVSVSGGQLVVGDALGKLFSGGSAGPPAAAPGLAWKLGTLEIRGVGVRLDDARPEVSDIGFQLNTTLRDLSPGQAADVLGGARQLVEIADLDVPSPLDPFTKVLTLRSIFLRFTLAGLLRKELDEVTILHPTIYVGEDLFWYMDDAQKRMGGGQPGTPGSPGWRIRRLDIKFGRVVLGSGGRVEYGLPLNFQTSAQDVSLDNLAALKMHAGLEIPAQDYAFESYQLKLSTQKGELRFAYPPEKSENNLVGTVRLDRILWRQYRASDSWISTTFDQTGINGEFGGQLYGGYISGGFSFLFDDRTPWIGWISGKGVDLRQLTDIATPKNFRMTGPLTFKVQTNANGSEIERLKGDFHATKPGRLTIGKLDDLLANIPDTWTAIKTSSTRIALETLRDFDYTKAAGDFWIVRRQGVVDLTLQGPQGSRNLKTVLHADESKEGRWKN